MALADKSSLFQCKTCLCGTDANKCHVVVISILSFKFKLLAFYLLFLITLF